MRVNRKELVEFQVDGTHGSAVAGLFGCRIQPRNATPKPVWNPDLAETHDYAADWMEVPDNDAFENGFKTQWEQFIRHVVEDAPHEFDFLAGARGVRLAEAGLQSSRTGAACRPARARPLSRHRCAELAEWRRRDDVRRRCRRRRRGLTAGSSPRAPALRRPTAPLRSRVAYAAAHVVPRVAGENVPGAPADIDWDATLAFRHHVWSWGLGVADAMDTAQRNMGLDATATRELIARCAAEARTVGGALVVGVNTDHVDDEVDLACTQVIDAYVEQLQFAEDHGAGMVLMASRHLARAATSRRRLRARLPGGARPGGAPGDPALAGRGVRPAARRLLRRNATSDRHRHRRRASSSENVDRVAASR